MKTSKGFTLIELLVVIAIVAILSTVVVITLNPAELLEQARDSNRVSDLSTINRAMSLYLADVSSTSISSGSTNSCFVSIPSAGVSVGNNCGMGGTWPTTASTSVALQRRVDGSGWVPVNFSAISSGAPMGNLPIDPINNGTYFSASAASTTGSTYEINANMESSKYSSGGAGDKESTDGGNTATAYEVGNISNKVY